MNNMPGILNKEAAMSLAQYYSKNKTIDKYPLIKIYEIEDGVALVKADKDWILDQPKKLIATSYEGDLEEE